MCKDFCLGDGKCTRSNTSVVRISHVQMPGFAAREIYPSGDGAARRRRFGWSTAARAERISRNGRGLFLSSAASPTRTQSQFWSIFEKVAVLDPPPDWSAWTKTR